MEFNWQTLADNASNVVAGYLTGNQMQPPTSMPAPAAPTATAPTGQPMAGGQGQEPLESGLTTMHYIAIGAAVLAAIGLIVYLKK